MRQLPLTTLLLLGLTACPGDEDDPDDTGEQADTDTDGDTDADADSDTDSDSDSDTDSDVEPSPCDEWQEESVAEPNCGPAPLTVEFCGSCLLSDADSYWSEGWDFGDGESSWNADTTHTYAQGDYSASFSATVDYDGMEVDLTLSDFHIRAY